jgi:multisubunit Na+/H+ antiporter MnhC subunit
MFWHFTIFIAALFVIGFYCLFFTYNLIRVLIGLEILIKAVTLLLVLAGYVSGRSSLAESFVITLIVIEVVIMVIACGVIVGLHSHNKSLDTRELRNLRG